jgi:hypothetical protein
MDNLSANELKILNQLSNVRDPSVDLGTLVDERTEPHPVMGEPVKWVAASKNLTIGGVVVNGETVSITNPALGHERDKYEFRTDDVQEVSEEGNIPVDISSNAVKAFVTLSVEVQPTSGDKMTIGLKEYTFVPVGTDTADGEISIGTDLVTAQANIIAAINGTDEFNEPHPLVTIGEFTSDDAAVTAIIGGTVGNSITSTETFTNEDNHFSAASLGSGANCSAANAVTALVLAVTENDTQGVSAQDEGLGGGVVIFTAVEVGVEGNEIGISEAMANGSFAGAATKLSGGVDGTPVYPGKLMCEGSNIYMWNGIDWIGFEGSTY